MTDTVRWEELLPEEFEQRLAARPVVYLPLGLCEPHGHIACFGLDTLKAEALCETAARADGGIVAPTLGYHVHETGYHGPWLQSVVGDVNPRLAALPPWVMYQVFLYLLRAYRNAGFGAVVAVTGHAGGNQHDLRRVAAAFDATFGLPHLVVADPELVDGHYVGDHAGAFEVSQLLALRPDLVRLDRLDRAKTDPLGRFAQGTDAGKATPAMGRSIMALAQKALVTRVRQLAPLGPPDRPIALAEVAELWREIDRLVWTAG